jgi:hypothetical protein
VSAAVSACCSRKCVFAFITKEVDFELILTDPSVLDPQLYRVPELKELSEKVCVEKSLDRRKDQCQDMTGSEVSTSEISRGEYPLGKIAYAEAGQ